METVEVVIRIPKEQYNNILNKGQVIALSGYEKMIGKGTVLPKGHDRLIEGDKLIEKIKPLISNKAIIEAIDTIITFSPTIIEADKEVTNENTT